MLINTKVINKAAAASEDFNDEAQTGTHSYGHDGTYGGMRRLDCVIWTELGLCPTCGGVCTDGACDGRGQPIDADLVDGPLFADAKKAA